MKYRYRNVQMKTQTSADGGTRLSEADLDKLVQLQTDDWEVHHTIAVQGADGATSHIIFMMRREIKV